MTCVKTGFTAYCEPHDAWLYGDAFEVDGTYIFRVCDQQFGGEVSIEPDFIINNWDVWFDETKTSMAQNSTLICRFDHVTMTEKMKAYLNG